MKYICNAAKEGRCKGEIGKCNHDIEHEALLINGTFEGSCTMERFCEMQQEMVRCVEVESFPNMKNLVMVSDELAREFVEWAKDKAFCNSGQHICDRLATRFEEQLKN